MAEPKKDFNSAQQTLIPKLDNNYEQLDARSQDMPPILTGKSKGDRSSMMGQSRLTKTTAASMRGGKEFPSRLGGFAKSEKPPRINHSKNQSSVHAKTVISKAARPRSKMHSREEYMSKAGEVLSYPYSFDEREKQT